MNHKTVNIQKIEQLKVCNENDLANIMLVYLGLKPACEGYYFEKDGLNILKKTLSIMGLYCTRKSFNKKFFADIQKTSRQKLYLPSGEFVVARDIKTADSLIKAMSGVNHRIYGKLMGYPQSAIHHFIKKANKLGFHEFEKLSQKHGLIFQFSIPAKNYQAELRLLKKWSQAIKRYSPKIYKKLVDMRLQSYKAFKNLPEEEFGE